MKKIRFGIVGTGNIAHRFAEAIKNVSDAELTSIASRTSENAEIFGNEFNIQHRFNSYESMAKSDKIDVAYIAVPHSSHKDCSMLMMRNGFYAPQEIELHLLDGTNEKLEARYWGNGFEEQIQHVCDCLNKGLKESPIITKEQTIFITKQMDEIRKDIEVIYPQDN